jgi:hypothetical protein
MSGMTVPFSPTEVWTFSPFGYVVAGIATEYAIYLLRPEGVLRIERALEPVAVDPAEKANAQDLAIDNMRNDDPGWEWTGPAIPDTKPHFLDLLVTQEGRIWVRVSQPGVPIPDEELVEPEPGPHGRKRAVRKWREPVAFDLFEPDGRYVGRVRAPMGVSMHPNPVIRGDTVWAVVRDELDVQRVARFRVGRITVR